MISEPPQPYQIGDLVFHRKFGRGVVKAIEGWASSQEAAAWKVDVDFEELGIKRVVGSFLRLEREVHRIDDLREAVSAYGQRALDVDRILTAFGQELLEALGTYLHREKKVVFGVPPQATWKPDTDYRHAAFSTHGRTIGLEPLDMGIGIRIDNLRDEGALWIRVVVSLRLQSENILVDVAGRSTVAVPLSSRGNLHPVCQCILETVIKRFSLEPEYAEASLYSEDAKIGFLTK